MIILKVYRIITWAERINRCTVRGARTSQGSFNQFANTFRRRRKLHLFQPETDPSRTAGRNRQPTKQRKCKIAHYCFENSELPWKADARMIEEDFRHLAVIMTRTTGDCKWPVRARPLEQRYQEEEAAEPRCLLAPNPVIPQRVEPRLEILFRALQANWFEKIAQGTPA